MSNRRAFLRAAGGAALGLGMFRSLGVAAQAAPKRVLLGGRRVSIVDVHAHCVFPEVSRRVPGINAPRVAPPTLVLGPERLAAMDERGIDIQALSVNAYWWYSASRDDARVVRGHHGARIVAARGVPPVGVDAERLDVDAALIHGGQPLGAAQDRQRGRAAF